MQFNEIRNSYENVSALKQRPLKLAEKNLNLKSMLILRCDYKYNSTRVLHSQLLRISSAAIMHSIKFKRIEMNSNRRLILSGAREPLIGRAIMRR